MFDFRCARVAHCGRLRHELARLSRAGDRDLGSVLGHTASPPFICTGLSPVQIQGGDGVLLRVSHENALYCNVSCGMFKGLSF